MLPKRNSDDCVGDAAPIQKLTGFAARSALAAIAGLFAGGGYFLLEQTAISKSEAADKPPAVQAGADRDGIIFRHDPKRPAQKSPPFNLTVGHGPNPNYKAENTVYRLGSNTLPNGYGEIPDIPVVSIEMESAWENPTTGKLWSEFHITGRDLDGSLTRPLTFSFEHGKMVDTLDLALTGNIFAINRGDGFAYFKLDSEKGRMYLSGEKGWTIEQDKNDSWLLSQAGMEGSSIVQVVKVDDQNRIRLGGANNRGVFSGGALYLGGQQRILPAQAGVAMSVGSDEQRTAMTIYGAGADVLTLEDGRKNRWALKPTGAFQIHDVKNNATLLHLDKGAPGNLIVGRKSGNVGIGTRNPQGKLHVAGALSLDAVSSLRNSSEGKAIIFLDKSSGRLMVRITHEGETRTVPLTEG